MQRVICPGCGVEVVSDNTQMDDQFEASAPCRQLMYELSYYTLGLGDAAFIHQLAVDTYAAAHYSKKVKPITIAFALVGLYLVNEKKFSGKKVQQVHTDLAKANSSKIWPEFDLPMSKNWLTIKDVLQVSDDRKQEMIRKWNQSVWNVWNKDEEKIVELLQRYCGLVAK